MSRQTVPCQRCSDDLGESLAGTRQGSDPVENIWQYRSDREPRFCSQGCARKANVPTQSANTDANVRVSVGTRDRLSEIRDGATHGETIAYLAGKHVNTVLGRRDVDTPDTGRYDETTKVRVSDGCLSVLKDLRDDMGAASLGDVVASLVAADPSTW